MGVGGGVERGIAGSSLRGCVIDGGPGLFEAGVGIGGEVDHSLRVDSGLLCDDRVDHVAQQLVYEFFCDGRE